MESMYACVVITALLKRNRCHFVEHGRAHDKWYSDITGKSFRVPRQSGRSLPAGTVTNILKDAGLT
jgi:mRNA interferase HicA